MNIFFSCKGSTFCISDKVHEDFRDFNWKWFHFTHHLPRPDSAPCSGSHHTSPCPGRKPRWPGRSELPWCPRAPPPWWSPAGPGTPSERTLCLERHPGSQAALQAQGHWMPSASAGLRWQTGCKSSSGQIHQSGSLCLEENRELPLQHGSKKNHVRGTVFQQIWSWMWAKAVEIHQNMSRNLLGWRSSVSRCGRDV